jgi:hypothetical protein
MNMGCPQIVLESANLSLCLTNEALRHKGVLGGGWINRSTFFLTSALVAGEWSAGRSVHFTS